MTHAYVTPAPNSVAAWRAGGAVTRALFMRHVDATARALPASYGGGGLKHLDGLVPPAAHVRQDLAADPRHVGQEDVMAVVGDGAAMYSFQSLWTAAHLGLGIVFVVLNNRRYRVLRDQLVASGGKSPRNDCGEAAARESAETAA